MGSTAVRAVQGGVSRVFRATSLHNQRRCALLGACNWPMREGCCWLLAGARQGHATASMRPIVGCRRLHQQIFFILLKKFIK